MCSLISCLTAFILSWPFACSGIWDIRNHLSNCVITYYSDGFICIPLLRKSADLTSVSMYCTISQRSSFWYWPISHTAHWWALWFCISFKAEGLAVLAQLNKCWQNTASPTHTEWLLIMNYNSLNYFFHFWCGSWEDSGSPTALSTPIWCPVFPPILNLWIILEETSYIPTYIYGLCTFQDVHLMLPCLLEND